jgi:hypothetical protein
MQISTIGIDIGKNSFHFVGFDARGGIVVRRQCSRTQLTRALANLPPCLVGMEACCGAHHLGRILVEQGHDVRLIPPQYMKPFVKSHKNDLLDAEAIGEAVQRPTMRFVPLKTMAQLDLQAIHRLRTRLVARRTAVINQMRGFLLERGFTVPITKPVVERFRLLQEREATLEVLSGHPLANALFPDGEEWAAPLRAIVSQTYPANLGFTRGELLEEIRAGITQMETPTDVDFVRVMSLHKSKGLTAKVVVVMGCIEGMIPRIDYDEPLAEQNRSLEEQRRLFYVALTRTTETLILSSVTYIPMQSAFQMGLGINAGQASRFMGELGPTRPAAIIGQALLDSIR